MQIILLIIWTPYKQGEANFIHISKRERVANCIHGTN